MTCSSRTPAQISNFQNYFSDTLHLGRNQYTLQRAEGGLDRGRRARSWAGSGARRRRSRRTCTSQIRPAGKNAPLIDPKPILDGWKLLEATAVYRAAGVDPFFGPGAKNASVGQVLLMSKQQLTERVLADPHVQIYNCGRRDIEAGLIDRRVLGDDRVPVGLRARSRTFPAWTAATASTPPPGSTQQGATGASLDISKINNIPILGHQGPGSITDITIRRLLTLQGSMAPDQIDQRHGVQGSANTLALPDHANRIQITFTPDFGTNKKLAAQVRTLLQPGQWVQLINRISQIPEPVVPIAPSKYAIRVADH